MESQRDRVMREFARKLKAARELKGLTMRALGGLVVPPMESSAVSRFESGERMPDLESAGKLARALGVKVDELLPDGWHEVAKKRKGK